MVVRASVAPASDRMGGHGVRHEAFFYSAEDDFLAGTVPFVLEGVGSGEDVLVAARPERLDALRRAVGPVGERRVRYADMRDLGANPARIISAWHDFVDRASTAGRGMRGIGEPIWAERGQQELVECQFHEALLNLAFSTGPDWRLMCPYDVAALDEEVVAEAIRSHPVLVAESIRRTSQNYQDDSAVAFFHHPLPEPAGLVEQLEFGAGDLARVHDVVRRHARRLGLGATRRDDALLAVHEVVTNSLRHGGGGGSLLAWSEADTLLFEVRDAGHIVDLLVGRSRPALHQTGGRGVWLANQLCDLVQIRSGPDGTAVRLHLRPSAVPG